MAAAEAQNPKRPLAPAGVLQRIDRNDPIGVNRTAHVSKSRAALAAPRLDCSRSSFVLDSFHSCGEVNGEIGGLVSDRDIWRTAHAMIEQFCDDAATRAAMRVDALLAEGDLDGHRVWKRVLTAINEIRREAPVDGESLN